MSVSLGDADQHLLLAILATHHVKLDYVAVAKRLGPQCTGRAVEERLKKLKRMARECGFDPSATDADQDSPPGSSVKPAAAPPPTKAEAAGAKPTAKLAPLGTKARQERKARKGTSKTRTPSHAQTDEDSSSSAEVPPIELFKKEESAEAGASNSPVNAVNAHGTKRSFKDYGDDSEDAEGAGASSEQDDEPTTDTEMAVE